MHVHSLNLKIFICVLLICCAGSFTLRMLKRIAPSRSSVNLKMISQQLDSIQSSLFGKINEALVLKPTDYTEVIGVRNWSEEAYSGKCEWFEEVKGSKLTGVAKAEMTSPNGASQISLDCWMGPAYSVPHMLLTITSDGSDKFGVISDYITRGPTPIGDYLLLNCNF